MSEFLTRFYLDPVLWDTYNDLIYRYFDRQFQEVEDHAIQQKLIAEAKKRIENGESADPHDPFFADRVSYHPWLFQYSEEESRLDALFGFLRVVDYNCAKGLISTGEVYRQLGTFLLTIEKRAVVVSYLAVNDYAWKQSSYRNEMGVDSPMRSVKNLLDCIKAYDEVIRIKRFFNLWRY